MLIKRMFLLIGMLLLLVVAGCSSQANQPGQTAKNNKNQQALGTETVSTKETNSKKSPESTISSFNWDQFSKEETKSKKEPSDNQKATDSIIPVSMKIPAINVKAKIIKVGQEPNGQMAVPKKWENVGWYKGGAKPGEKGSSILAGHVDSQAGPAVFFNLEDLKKGDLVYVTGKDGNTLAFKVFKKKAYPRNNAPVEKIFGYTPARVVRMITCTGQFNYEAGTHNKRLVVSAKLVEKT